MRSVAMGSGFWLVQMSAWLVITADLSAFCEAWEIGDAAAGQREHGGGQKPTTPNSPNPLGTYTMRIGRCGLMRISISSLPGVSCAK
jgi:hypothetical protein